MPKVRHLTLTVQKTMTLQLEVPKIACAGCVNTVTKAIKSVDTNATVQADAKTKLVAVETSAPETAIKEAIAQVGYPAT